jgi:signal transduction histidine kinase
MGSDDPPQGGPRHFTFLVSRPGGSTIRTVVVCGFVIIFGLWFVSTYALVQRVSEAERESSAITARFTAGEELLFSMRAQVLLSSVYVRDAALDPRPDGSSFYREQLRAARADVEQASERYLPQVDSAIEREHWARFQTELQDYWTSLAPVLAGEVIGTPTDAYAFLRREVVPRRDLIVRISDDLRVLNQDALEQQQADVARLHQALRQRLWWTSGVAVIFALAIALFAARHAGRLEGRIREQHLQERQHKRELQRLSAELVHAQENERRTIGRDLHDEIGQALLTIKLDLGAIERSGQVSGAAAHALAEARSTTDHAVQSVRDLSQLLHPAMLDQFGLAVTLEAYVRSFSARTGIRTDLVQDRMEGRLASELEIAVYRVVQEALTNVSKHAQATSCRIYLHRLPYSLLVTVEDDGAGFDRGRLNGTNERPGVGLLGVRERVSQLGGTFRLDTHVGKGTRLTIELPTAGGDTVRRDMAPAGSAVAPGTSEDMSTQSTATGKTAVSATPEKAPSVLASPERT